MPIATGTDSDIEAALLARLRSDDEADGYDAAVEIVRRYRSTIEEGAWHILDAWDPAEDVAQDVSIEFIQNHRTIAVREGLQQYFFHAGRTRARNMLRGDGRALQQKVGAVSDNDTVDNDGLLYLAADDLVREVHSAIKGMPESQRRIFLMITRDKQTHDEVARLLCVSRKTVDNNMWMANNDIRKCLANGQWTRTWNAADLPQITDAVWTLMEKQHA